MWHFRGPSNLKLPAATAVVPHRSVAVLAVGSEAEPRSSRSRREPPDRNTRRAADDGYTGRRSSRERDGRTSYAGKRVTTKRWESAQAPAQADRDSSSTAEAAPEQLPRRRLWGGQDNVASSASEPGRSPAGQGPAPSTPPKPPPPVKPRMDLPIVREQDRDKGTFFAGSTFAGLGLAQDIQAALRTLGVKKPSHIQAATLEAWRSAEAQHLVLLDQAGSGKTLAYLLPIFQALRAEDAAAGKALTQPKSPRAVVLAPTVELVQQVYRVAKALSGAGARLRVAAMTGGQLSERERSRGWRTQRELLASGVDLVIATPGRLMEHLHHGTADLGSCKAVVMDEVDVLLGENTAFAAQVDPIKAAAHPGLRFIMVTATLPQHSALQLKESFRDMALVSGPGLHRTAAGLTEELVDCSGGEEVSLEAGTKRKLEALGKVLRNHNAQRALIFCNKIESCRAVENALRRAHAPEEMQVLVYHEAIREDVRQAAMNAFLSPPGKEGEALSALAAINSSMVASPSSSSKAESSTQEGSSSSSSAGKPAPPRLVMVATDRMSRGIDCMHCEHVVLFDFPRDPSEYVRRVGRTARGAGGKGVVSTLVLGRQVALAQEIIGRNQKGQPVHRIPEL